MISLTRLSGQRFALNPDLIERIEATPDSVITLVDGGRHVVAEDVDAVIALVREFRAGVIALAQRMQVLQPADGPPAVVTPVDVPATASPALRLIAPEGGER